MKRTPMQRAAAVAGGSLLFFLAVMLLARMIGHSRELQQDNDLFI